MDGQTTTPKPRDLVFVPQGSGGKPRFAIVLELVAEDGTTIGHGDNRSPVWVWLIEGTSKDRDDMARVTIKMGSPVQGLLGLRDTTYFREDYVGRYSVTEVQVDRAARRAPYALYGKLQGVFDEFKKKACGR